MTQVHVRDRQGNPLCGQSQAYLRRSVTEFADLPAHSQCKKCLRLMMAAPFSDTAQRFETAADVDRALGRTDRLLNRDPGNTNAITMYIHCGQCLGEMPPGHSPSSWARLAVGWTVAGLQVWCERHNANVLHVDFEGQRHPANTTRRGAA